MTSSLDEALEGTRIVFMAVPSHGFRDVLKVCDRPLPARWRPSSAWPRGSRWERICGCPRWSPRSFPASQPACSPDRTSPARSPTATRRPASSPCPTSATGRARPGAGAHPDLPHLHRHRRGRVRDRRRHQERDGHRRGHRRRAGPGRQHPGRADHEGTGRARPARRLAGRQGADLRRPGRRGRPGGHVCQPAEPEPVGGFRAG